MSITSRVVAAGIAAAIFSCAPAQATTQIGHGTVSIVGLYNPTINLASTPNTYTANNGATFQITGTGAFSSVTGGLGVMNGVINFSNSIGTTLNQTLANFFSFSDGQGGSYQFSLASVKTITYAVTPNISSSIGLYLLGDTVDTHLGLASTPTSLTLSFNSTGNSPYSASATLAVPPSPIPSVPEPATWALTLIGFGAMGAALRRRPRTSVTFA